METGTTMGTFGAFNVTGPGSYSVTALWEDNDVLENSVGAGVHLTDSGTNDGGGITVFTTVVLYAVDRIEVQAEGSWQTVSDTTTDIVHGSEFTFRAIPKPADYTWQAGEPQWSGPQTSGTGAQITVEFIGWWIGTNALTAAVGVLSPKSATFRTTDFQQEQYKRSGKPTDYYKTDGGGVNGSTLADASFDYRLLFIDTGSPPDHVQFSAGFNPLALLGQVWDLDGFDELIVSNVGKNFSLALASTELQLGTTRIRYFIDENWNDERDSIWPSEQVKDTEFQNKENNVISRTVKYASTITLTPSEMADAMQNAFTDSALIVQRRDHVNDYRSLVEFEVESLGTFTAQTRTNWDPNDPDSIPEGIWNEASKDRLFDKVDADIIIVNFIDWVIAGIVSEGNVIVPLNLLSAQPHVLIHELGHVCGLDDYGPTDHWLWDMANHFAPCVEMTNPTEFERHRLMYHFGGLDPRNHLWESEASAFQGY